MMAITRQSKIPFGKHKDTKLSDIPDDYLNWLGNESDEPDKPWSTAARAELALRADGKGTAPADTEHLGGKQILDNLVVAFHYIASSLKKLGYETTGQMVEAVQKLATSAAIAANDQGIDLRKAVGGRLAKKASPPTEEDPEEAEPDELPF